MAVPVFAALRRAACYAQGRAELSTDDSHVTRAFLRNWRRSVDLGHEVLARLFRAFVVVRLAGRQFDLHRL